MKKIKGHILYAELTSITNRSTGVVSPMTKIFYTIEMDSSENHVGVGTLECYKIGNYLKAIEPFTKYQNLGGKMVRPLYDIELEERYIKNGQKLYIHSIDGNVLV